MQPRPAGKTVTRTPEFQGSWLSYCGAVAGVLKSLGIDCDVVDVAGYSGYAFLVNVTEGWTDPGSPTLHSGNVARTVQPVMDLWAEINKCAERLGFKIEHDWDPKQFRFGKALPPADAERARQLFERVQQAIDRDRPVVVWGLVVPEYGIVKGYTDDHYLVSTFRSTIGQAEEPIKYDVLNAKGGLEALFFAEATPPLSEADDSAAIQRAAVMAAGTRFTFVFDTPRHPIRETQRYITGPAAYDEWARVLEESKPNTVYYEYNSYVAACLHEAKGMEASFVKRLAENYAGRAQAQFLDRAAGEYRRAEGLMQQFTALFPYADSGELPSEKCRAGAALLRQVKPHELAALDYLQAAGHAWT